MIEEVLATYGKEGVFAGLFIWLLIRTMKRSDEREEKLYTFLDGMKIEFSKLVGSYESLTQDVAEIRADLDEQKKVKLTQDVADMRADFDEHRRDKGE